MRYDYCATINCDVTGAFLMHIEVEIDADASLEAGVPIIEVSGVYVDGHNLMRGDPLAQKIAAAVSDLAESDSEFVAKVAEADGFVYRGMGGNDPDGHFVRVS